MRCLMDKRTKRQSRILGFDQSTHEFLWFAALDSKQRQQVATWSRQRVRLVIEDAYNTSTMTGQTYASMWMSPDRPAKKIDAGTAILRYLIARDRAAAAAMWDEVATPEEAYATEGLS
jgi:hypothetical protein